MPFTIVRQDITKMKVDAIVNAANTELLMGGGVCGAIFRTAGAKELQEACDKVAPIQTGGAAITPGFKLPAKYVIHAAGPVYSMQSSEKSEALLRSAYTESLKLAAAHHCESIAFPLISSGIYGYPKAEALQVASAAIRDFLVEHDLDVFLAVFDNSAFAASKKLMGDVQSYIDEHYVDAHFFERSRLLNVENRALQEGAQVSKDESASHDVGTSAFENSSCDADTSVFESASCDASNVYDFEEAITSASEMDPRHAKEGLHKKTKGSGLKPFQRKSDKTRKPTMPPKAAKSSDTTDAPQMADASLSHFLNHMDEPFSDTLFHLIDEKGKTDVEVYKRANIDRKLFSKIRSVKGYTPKKATILALAIALELSLTETDQLLERAGYALSHASKFDVIVEFFIINGKYNIFEINEVLFQYDQPLLGA